MRDQIKILKLLYARSEQALSELHSSYGGLCQSIAKNILSSQEDVEEIVSDTMLAVWDSIPPAHPESLAAYISRITRNLAISRLRHNTATIRDDRLNICLDELLCCLPDTRTPESEFEGKQITHCINTFLAAQSKTNRVIFVRRYYCMDSTKEIARKVGLTDQAVRSRLLRMRGELRQLLEKEGINV